MYDVMATLRRGGPPYELTAGELVQQAMVTTGAITNRIDRLEALGFVERAAGEDRRKVFVRLTPAGLQKVEEVVVTHLRTEKELLASLTKTEQKAPASVLRGLLLEMGDEA